MKSKYQITFIIMCISPWHGDHMVLRSVNGHYGQWVGLEAILKVVIKRVNILERSQTTEPRTEGEKIDNTSTL